VEQSVDGGGGSQVPATGDIGHWNAVVDKVRRCLIPETLVDGHGKLVLHSLVAGALQKIKRGYD